MKKKLLKIGILSVCLLFAFGVKAQTTIDFNDLAPFEGTTLETEGFTFACSYDGVADTTYLMKIETAEGYASPCLINLDYEKGIILTKTDNSAFNLESFKFAGDPWGTASDVIVTGTHPDESTQTITFTANDGIVLTTKSVNWANLTKVLFEFKGGENTAFGPIDDIVLPAAITLVPATSIDVSTLGNVTSIEIWEKLQFSAEVAPEGSTDDLVWSVVNGTGSATISLLGLLTPISIGTVTIHAEAGAVSSDYVLNITPTILTTLIDFNSLEKGEVGLTLNIGGYTFTAAQFGVPIDWDPLAISTEYESKSLLNNNYGNGIILTRTDNSAFNLASFDFAASPWEPSDVTVTGTFADATTLIKVVTATSKDYVNTVLNWINLSNVYFDFGDGENNAYGPLDNISLPSEIIISINSSKLSEFTGTVNNSLLQLNFAKEVNNVQVVIFDTQGRQMKTVFVSGKMATVNIENLNRGVYIVKTAKSTFRFIK